MAESNSATLEETKTAFADLLDKGLAKHSEKLDAQSKHLKEANDAQLAEFKTTLAQIQEMSRTFSVPGSEEAKHKGQKYSFAKAMASVALRDPSVAPMEHAMSEEVKKRGGGHFTLGKAMSFGVDTAGGFLVPNEVALNELIPLLYAESVVAEMGARKLSGLTKSPFQIPRVSGGTTAFFLGEGATITASDMATQMLDLNPHGIAAVTVLSDLLQVLDSPDVENMVRADMGTQLALAEDLKALTGTGASSTPVGVLNANGVQTATLSDPGTYNQFRSFVSKVRGANALKGKPGWIVSNDDMLEIETIKDLTQAPATPGNGDVNVQPLGSRSLLTGEWPNYRMLGFPLKVSTQLVDGQVFFGNWDDLMLAQWGGMRFDMTNALGLLTGQTHIRVLTYVDVGVRHGASFCIPA